MNSAHPTTLTYANEKVSAQACSAEISAWESAAGRESAQLQRDSLLMMDESDQSPSINPIAYVGRK